MSDYQRRERSNVLSFSIKDNNYKSKDSARKCTFSPLTTDFNKLNKDEIYQALLMHRKYRPSVLQRDYPISEDYFMDSANLNRSHMHSSEGVNEPGRRTQTSQANSEAFIQFPHLAKNKANDSFETKKEFSLQIHRVVIRHKILQKKKLPMIMHKKSSLRPLKSASDEGKLLASKSKREAKDKCSPNSRSGKIENWGTSCKDANSNKVKCEKEIEPKLSARQDIIPSKKFSPSYNRLAKKEALPQALLAEPVVKDKKRGRKKRTSIIKQTKVPESVIIVPKPRPVFASSDFYLVTCLAHY